jgi:hypothetical protein
MPTVLDLLHSRPRVRRGTLLARMTGATHEPQLETYSETVSRYHFGWSELRALRQAPRRRRLGPSSRPRHRPRRGTQLYQPARRLPRPLRLRARGSRGTDAPGTVDPDAVARLAALGYVAGSAEGREPRALLADPKDKIDLYQLITGDRDRDVSAAPDRSGHPGH